jgi:hypothetical protein
VDLGGGWMDGLIGQVDLGIQRNIYFVDFMVDTLSFLLSFLVCLIA